MKANAIPIKDPNTSPFFLTIVGELETSGMCNVLNEVAFAARQAATNKVAERMDEGLKMFEAEDEQFYKNRILQYDVLLLVAEALDIGSNEQFGVRRDKLKSLIGELEKLRVVI